VKLGREYTALWHWGKIGLSALVLITSIITRTGGMYAILTLFTLVVMLAGGYKRTFTIVLDNGTLVLTGVNLIFRTVVSYNIQDIWLELIYSGSTGKETDAMLNVFEGKKCVRQVHVKEGYTEEAFKNLITAFYVMKTSSAA